MVVSEITAQNVANYLKLNYESLTDDELAELSAFLDTAKAFLVSYTGLDLTTIDSFSEFVVAVYVLIQDMYDNRSMYVDKNNLNKVVEIILNMHSSNLL
ncbi:hypothetical protein FACS189465_2590 [Clostridia bacterium]|nr:hypothetical protein FACS189465_2590 [Clostridia bacterium]